MACNTAEKVCELPPRKWTAEVARREVGLLGSDDAARARQAFLDQTGEPWQPLEARYREVSIDEARASLGDEEFRRAYADGRGLSVEGGFDFVLGRVRST